MINSQPTDKKIHTPSILDAVLDGQALSVHEAKHLLELSHKDELESLQQAAFEIARRQTLATIPPVFSSSLFLTNLCELQPSIYSYPRQPGQVGAYTLTIDNIDAVLELCQTQKNPHLAISGGGFWSVLRIPGLEKPNILKTHGCLLEYVREKCPDVSITGFSPDEVEFLSVISNRSPRYILEFLKDHGLQTLEGYHGGLLVTGVRKKISPKLMPLKDWLDLVQMAAKLQMPTRLRCELGHWETVPDRVQHLALIRDFLQMQARKTEKTFFSELVPQLLTSNALAQSEWIGLQMAAPQDRMKWLAVSRLFLGEWLPVQQSFWQAESSDPTDEAQAGLQWGANRLGNTDALAYSEFLLGSQPATWLFPPFTQADLQKRQREHFDFPGQSQ